MIWVILIHPNFHLFAGYKDIYRYEQIHENDAAEP